MKEKIWTRLFEHLALVLGLFSIAICIANLFFLDDYFVWREKILLSHSAEVVLGIDLTDRDAASEKLSRIEDTNNLYITIYEDDTIVYSTLRSGRPGMTGFDLLVDLGDRYQKENVVDFRSGKFYHATNMDGNKLFAFTSDKGDKSVVLAVQQSLISNAANTAGSFMMTVAGVGLVIALISSIVFSKRFSRPIIQMNKIAKNMSKLDFSERVCVDSEDEIGQLGESINELSGALDMALCELSEKNKHLQSEIDAERRMDGVRKAFVAGVSHELKTPISIIRGYTELLEAAPPERKQEYCECILNETDRMSSLVINLLELSRIESGMKANVTDFDLTALTANALDAMGKSFDDKQINLELDMSERLMVSSDEMLVRHVLLNYLSNAASHTEVGGTVRIFTEPYNAGLRLCVFNTGSHIAEDDFENLWKSFYRGDKSHNRDSGRYGLGLSIVRASMTALGCDFGVYNTENGVCFWAEIKVKNDQ